MILIFGDSKIKAKQQHDRRSEIAGQVASVTWGVGNRSDAQIPKRPGTHICGCLEGGENAFDWDTNPQRTRGKNTLKRCSLSKKQGEFFYEHKS